MNAQSIADRLLDSPKPITPARVQKLTGLCLRSGVELSEVLALLPANVREQVKA